MSAIITDDYSVDVNDIHFDIRQGLAVNLSQLWDDVESTKSKNIIIDHDCSMKLKGNDNDNFIYGKGGSDKIFGYGGNDFISGGTGKDTIDGGDGNDYLRGGKGSDKIIGGAGDDFISGRRGKDFIDAGTGNDTVYISDRDRITLGDGNDILSLEFFGGTHKNAYVKDFKLGEDKLIVGKLGAGENVYVQDNELFIGTKGTNIILEGVDKDVVLQEGTDYEVF